MHSTLTHFHYDAYFVYMYLLLELQWCNVDDIKSSHGLWSLSGLALLVIGVLKLF